jgi:uncharacterized repeat protein (TIGR03843 family)
VLSLTDLADADLALEGRVRGASNATLRARIGEARCVYKPVAGERPLWDFPDATLGRREVAAHALSEALGWHLVPPTAWRDDGPAGPGMCQAWIEHDASREKVGVVPPDGLPDGWVAVIEAEDEVGRPVLLAHEDSPDLQRLAVFDAIVNNADRKGGHVLVDRHGRLWGIDHGVTFADEPKLRTVLWGWAGQPLPDHVVADLTALARLLAPGYDPVDRWLAEEEREALRDRLADLRRTGEFPVPAGRWPAFPWPAF